MADNNTTEVSTPKSRLGWINEDVIDCLGHKLDANLVFERYDSYLNPGSGLKNKAYTEYKKVLIHNKHEIRKHLEELELDDVDTFVTSSVNTVSFKNDGTWELKMEADGFNDIVSLALEPI